MLLTTIHGYYLQALARLPKDKLRSRYHHSLLLAGHCYGPLDPVSNIILNTLWYSHAYPLTLEKNVEVEAISTKPLLRIAVRSLYGLVSFLCTSYPALTPGEALRRLHVAAADLRVAQGDPTLLDNHSGAPPVPVEEAYAAAAKAAYHPKPHQQAEFLGPSNTVLSAFSQVLQLDDPGKIHQLLLSVVTSSSVIAQETKNINVLSPWDYSFVMGIVGDFWDNHSRAVRMVKSAIDMYSQQHGVPKYELHVICGVNEYVDAPVLVTPFENMYRCSHINFLATQTAGTRPVLFFAECRNDGSGVGLCCTVAVPLPGAEQVRCLYCECMGSRIVHPAVKEERFRGRTTEFEKMLGGDEVYSQGYRNNDIISGSHEETLWVDYLEEDQIYGDYVCDHSKVEEKFPRDLF
ncbi:uncharacterized protein [Lolium perenne]|uniref:uncharacterized protein n=1 Tax=Lolium perenne TaxID=4522 RepID=UPI003A9A13D8